MSCNPSDIIEKAQIVLHDTTSIRWLPEELLGWYNDGRIELVNMRPDANAVTETVTPTASTAMQSIPDDAVQLLDIIGNNSSSSSRGVSLVDRVLLDAQVPDWRVSTEDEEIIHYCYDEMNPRVYWLYPRPSSASRLLMVYAKEPDAVTSASATTDELDAVYAPALLNYVLYRAYSKDADYASNHSRMTEAYNAFQTCLGLRSSREKMDDPNIVQPERSTGIRN